MNFRVTLNRFTMRASGGLPRRCGGAATAARPRAYFRLFATAADRLWMASQHGINRVGRAPRGSPVAVADRADIRENAA